MKHGLLPLKPDNRDYKLKNLGGLFAQPITVPLVDFLIANPAVLDQGDTQACTAFATCVASGLQEHTDLSPEYTFAKSHEIANDPTDGPLDLRSACKSHVQYGAIKQEQSPLSFSKDPSTTIADWTKWPQFLDYSVAILYRKKTFISVEGGPGDLFDNILSTLWLHKDDPKPSAVVTGITWCSEWLHSPDGIIRANGTPLSGHAYLYVGQKIIDGEPYLVAHLSNTTGIGDGGRFYFGRKLVNEGCVFGNYIFKDLTDAEVARLKNSPCGFIRKLFGLCGKK